MMKNDYREFFAQCKLYLKLNRFCEIANVNRINLSRFLKGESYNWCMSIDSCKRLYDCINNVLDKIA